MLPVRPPTFAFVLALGLSSVLGCGATPAANSPDQVRLAIAGVDTRLRGAWVLQAFTPEVPLEPMLKLMLEFQFGKLTAKFDGKRFVAESPGIHVERTYQISEVNGDSFKLTAFDDEGVPYETWGTFLFDGRIEIRSVTMPWKGTGTLARAPI